MSTTKRDSKEAGEEPDITAQTELKRAYLHVSFGQYDEAIAAAKRAAQIAPEHHLPPTLEGSFELAAGRVRKALGTLRKVTKRHPDQVLPQIHFAEACFMAGRHRQAKRAMDRASGMEAAAEHAQLLEELERTWGSVEPSEVPPPLVVKQDGAG